MSNHGSQDSVDVANANTSSAFDNMYLFGKVKENKT